jgi:hypothetical protein
MKLTWIMPVSVGFTLRGLRGIGGGDRTLRLAFAKTLDGLMIVIDYHMNANHLQFVSR